MKQLTIKYKEISFDVNLVEEEDRLRVDSISNDSNNEIVEDFNDDVFFTRFSGEPYPLDEEHNILSSIKRSFSKFVRNYDKDEDVERVEENEPVGAVDQIIFDTVSRALGGSETKAKIDGLIQKLIKEHGIVPHKTVLEVKFRD
jgi:hypothetical protein